MAGETGKLLEFYGRECPHCNRMHPLVERLEKELGVKVEKYEVWHDASNAVRMERYDKGFCGGVPFFYNEQSRHWVCGEVPYEQIKGWAQGTWGHGKG